MKHSIFKTTLAICIAVSGFFSTQPVSAQYYQIANQLPGLLSPALSGSMNYKGYVDISGIAGFGNNRANFIGISTSQGFQYSSWFFMGVGVGIDIAMTNKNDDDEMFPGGPYPDYYGHAFSQTKAMIPVFSDFRFNIGSPSDVSVFIDLKVGATWLIGDSYLWLQRGRLGGGTQFYLKPSIGFRVPVSTTTPRQAINFGVTYQLITSNNNWTYWNSNSATLNGLGLTIAYEW